MCSRPIVTEIDACGYRANQNGAPGFRQPKQIARQPYLPRWVGGGPGNPLGARTLYLGNTDHRIYGTNNPASIGTQVSSGCIRMRNADAGCAAIHT